MAVKVTKVEKAASAKLQIEELQLQNEHLRKQVLELIEESDKLKERLKETELENSRLELQLGISSPDLDSFHLV